MDSNDKMTILKRISEEKISEWTQIDTLNTRYSGGDMDWDVTVYAKYEPVAPADCGVAINSTEHKAMPDFQSPLFTCPFSNGEIYISKFNNTGLQGTGFGYTKVETEYYCPQSSLSYRLDGEWK